MKKRNNLLVTFASLGFAVMVSLFLIAACGGGRNELDANDKIGGNNIMTDQNDRFDYEKLWQKVEEFNNQGLPKSALEVVEKIYKTAKDNKNAAEIIKALIHKLRFIQEVEEDSFLKIYNQLTGELDQSQFPITPVLHSMLAEQTWSFYQSNRYRFLNRTNIADADMKQDDIRTWDLRKIVQAIVDHYQKSLADPENAKKTKIDIYDKILIPGTDSRKYRPTLYDFLAHRAIDFFMDSESGLTQPVYRFSLNKEEYFSDVREFAKLEIATLDPMAFHYYALTGLQNLVKFHLNDEKPDALVDVDLKRLQFLYSEAVLSNKEILYEKMLRQMIETYGASPAAADIYYELASYYDNLGNKFKPTPPTYHGGAKGSVETQPQEQYKWYKKKAHDLCNEAVKKYPGSPGARNCTDLINRIEGGQLDIIVENAAAVRTASPALVKCRNLTKIYLKIVKTDRDEIQKKNNLRIDELVDFYKKKSTAAAWETTLVDDGDFQEHSAEMKVPGLEPGEYVLLGSNNSAFDFDENQLHAVAYSFLTVSDIAYVHRNRGNDGLDFYLMNRQTGQPLANARAQAWSQEYSKWSHAYVPKKGPLFQTDANGYFNIPQSHFDRNSFQLEFIDSAGKDRLYTQQNFYSYRQGEPSPNQWRTIFFTDRGIYRPGQTLYFKGIMLLLDNNNAENNRIMPKQPTHVTFYDVNRQEVGHLDVVTNEYGTFSGTFQTPVGRLNGNMTISDGYGSAAFSVEEYKRPKFQVLFDPMKETYRLDDMVTVKGRAAAYAGYNIDNADVKYRVVREAFYPYPWYCWYWRPPTSPTMEILNDVAKTDEKGEFQITFKAVPDLSLAKETQPAFNFTVYAEVTDVNGETQQASKKTPIGYTALKISINLPEQLDRETDQPTFTLNTATLSGDFVPAAGEIAFYKLKEPNRVFRKKSWDAPDRFTMSQDDYYKLFPHDGYANEDNSRNWEKEKKVFSGHFDTGEVKELKLSDLNRWEIGKYVMEMTSGDRYGNPVKEVIYFTLYSTKGKNTPGKELGWFIVPKNVVEPGETAALLLGSAEQDVRVLYEIEYRGKILEKKLVELNNEQKRIEIPILEKYRGNIGLHLFFIKFNRIFTYNPTITVPWSNKELDIAFETFRNKLTPGAQEEWRLKIRGKKGPKGEPGGKVEAEMLATLYDASLDAFRPLYWDFSVYPSYYSRYLWENNNYFSTVGTSRIGTLQKPSDYYARMYDELNWFDFSWWGGGRYRFQRVGAGAIPPPAPGMVRQPSPVALAESAPAMDNMMEGTASIKMAAKKKNGDKDETARSISGEAGGGKTPGQEPPADKAGVDLSTVKARVNFQETAFFYPHLKTNPEGEIIISFTIPEALTKWKMMGFGHTRDLKYGFVSNELVTQKELMVVPNAPRFFREGDTLELATKITNLSEGELTGNVQLMLFDAATMQPVDAKFKNDNAGWTFKALKGQSDRVSWTIRIPDDVDTVIYRIVAKSGQFSDGEEQAVPILKNRMLVTESLPLPVRSKQTKDFQFKKLVDASSSTTIKNHKLTLEFTSNPVWYAVQALPYLMEYPYECMEQVFSRYYANSIASYIVNSNPRIKRVFEIWQNAQGAAGGNALLSNLEKNQELKTLMLEETPWVLNAKDETERKRRIALLFDLAKMSVQLDSALKKLVDGQMPSGAWAWFNGMYENRYITQYIVSGFAHLERLKVIDSRNDKKIWNMLQNAVPYLDLKIKEDYEGLLKYKMKLEDMQISYLQIHYLYVRGYFKDIPMDDGIKTAFEYYKGQAEKYWLKFNKYMQGMIALALERYDNHKTAVAIVNSIKEYALYSEEMGMYWKESWGYYWYQSAIETQALLIEVFDEVLGDKEAVDGMKTWLLKQKQTQDWGTTKSTANACYALLLKGEDWLAENQPPEITMGKAKKITIEPQKMDDVKVEAGTGYFKTSWSGGDVNPDMGYITIKNNNNVAAWGSLYWQYFENLDKITPAETPLQLKKQLFIERPSDTGPVLKPLDKSQLKIGDRVKVRIELRVDRDMEYVHMKDMRAAGFEPENVISRCKWQGGLCYYESTKDASTNFFIDYLPRGTYVFEYPLRVSHAGDFSNGITTIQCMYAPEFSSHSEGVRVQVVEK